MKIALVSSSVPFVAGGYRNIVDWLDAQLTEAGHHVEKIYLPEVDDAKLLYQQMAAFRWIDLSAADRVICFRPQSHMIRHPHKIVWFIHHIRSYYDLWNTPYRGVPNDAEHQAFRAALQKADTAALLEAKKVFTNSEIVKKRLTKFNKIQSEVLYPPVYQSERYHCAGYSDEIVCICRMEHHKRQHLLIEAMEHVTTPVRLRLLGASGDHKYPAELKKNARALDLGNQITIEDRWISEEKKVDILSKCLAAAYLPFDEDSYGYPSIEASHSQKPILTTTDSGGVLELVTDGHNGLVATPDPKSIAAAMDQLFTQRQKTQDMGKNAKNRLKTLNVSWAHVVERLLA